MISVKLKIIPKYIKMSLKVIDYKLEYTGAFIARFA